MKAYTERFNNEQIEVNATELAKFIFEAASKAGFKSDLAESELKTLMAKTAKSKQTWTSLFWCHGVTINAHIAHSPSSTYGITIDATLRFSPQIGSIENAIKIINRQKLAVEFAMLLSNASVE